MLTLQPRSTLFPYTTLFRSDDDAERRVEEEVPQPDPPALAEGGIRVGRDQEERTAAQPVKDADGRVEGPDLRDLGRPDREEVADEHRAHLLGAVRRPVREERSEERRVGKECRYRSTRDHRK